MMAVRVSPPQRLRGGGEWGAGVVVPKQMREPEAVASGSLVSMCFAWPLFGLLADVGKDATIDVEDMSVDGVAGLGGDAHALSVHRQGSTQEHHSCKNCS